MKRLCMMMLALCAAVSTAYCGTTYYLKPGATDLSVKESYTTGSAGGATATEPPGAADEVVVPAGTFAIAGGSTSFTTLSGVKRVRPENGAVLEITVGDNDTQTFEAPVNWNGESFVYNSEGNIKGYGKIVKKGNGTLILASSGNTKYGTSYNQDYFTGLEIVQGTLKMPQYAVGNMYFGDVAISNGATLVTCGDLNDDEKGTQTLVLSLSGYGTITNESGRLRNGQAFSTIERTIMVDNEFHGRFCHPVRFWLEGRLVHYGHDTGIELPVVVQNNRGDLNNGKGRGVYAFEDAAMLGPGAFVQYYGEGGGLHYFGGEDTTIAKPQYLYCYKYPVFFDAGWHGGIRFTGGWSVAGDSSSAACQKWLVLMGSNTVPCTIEGGFGENAFLGQTWASPDGIPYTIVVQKLGSGTWRFKGTRRHGGGFAIEEGTLQFDSIDEKGMSCSLGLSTNLTDLTTARDLSTHRKPYAFTLGSTNASAPKAVFEYMGHVPAVCTTRPLVLVGKGGALRASDGRLTFGDVSARDANATPTLTLDGTGSGNIARNISDGATGAKVNVTKDGTGSWTLAGAQTFTGDITVKQGHLAIRAPVSAKYADYKWFRLSIAQIGSGGVNEMRIRQISLFDKDGVRQNAGLTLAGLPETSAGLVLAPTNIAPGQVYYDRSAAGKTVVSFANSGDWVSGSLAYAFDEVYSGGNGGCFTIKWKSGSNNCSPNPSDRSTWIPIVMHLPDSANPITHFDIVGINRTTDTNSGYLPTRIQLEGSHDGAVWDEVYSNVGTSDQLLAQNNTGYNQWISDGGISSTVDSRSRPIDKGCLLSKSGDLERSYFSWFRLSIAELGDNNNNGSASDNSTLSIRKISLFDKYGIRLNSGLTMAEGPTTEDKQSRTILGTVPQAGQVGYDVSAAGKIMYSFYAGELEELFDEAYSGNDGRNIFIWNDGSNTPLVPNPMNRNTWIPIVMHLETAVNVHHFDIQCFDNNDWRSPKRIMLEGSADGVDWYVLYNNATTGEANSITPESYNWWLSDGVEGKSANHARPEGTGFAVSTSYVPEEVVTQFPGGVNVQVLPGATLTAENATQTIKSLKVDSAGAGTLDGFTFAENGTIDVTFADAFPQTAALPGTYVNCEGLENVAGWNIKVNGSPSGKYRVSVKDGAITFVVRGLTISFR